MERHRIADWRRRNLAGPIFQLSDRDGRILHFLWRWKVAPTATLHEVIGKPNTPYSTYKAMERLERTGYAESLSNHMERFCVWQLTEKGFETLRERLGDLKEEGYQSENKNHDRHVLAFQLGEWAPYNFPLVKHFTEQELRRRSVDYYPDWVPKIGQHRSDGYTRIEGPKKAWNLSFEVELWPKSQAIYESVIRYYRMYRELDRVYWLLGSGEVRNQILQAKSRSQDEDDNYHLFVDLAEYEKLGWDAPAKNARSETLFTLRKGYQGMIGEPLGSVLGPLQGQPTSPVHYTPGKVLGKPRGYGDTEFRDNS